MSVPADLKYTRDHEWVRVTGQTAVVGITAFAVESLGDVVFVETPTIGDELTVGQACGEVESTKAVGDLYSPVTGRVLAVNASLIAAPALLSSDPYGEGWLFEVAFDGSVEGLLDAAAYASLIDTGGR